MKKLNYIGMLFLGLIFSFILFSACSDGTAEPETDGDIETDGDEENPPVDGDEEIIDGDGDSDGDIEDKPDGDGSDGDIETDGDTGPDEDVDLGIFWLENAETELANQAFKRAFDRNPDNPRARFGYAFSEAMLGYDTFFLAIQALEGQLLAPAPLRWKDQNYEDINDWFDKEFLHIMDLIDGYFLHAVEIYGPLKESGGLSIYFDHLPIHVGINEYTWISGEIDDADVFIFDGMARLGAMIFEFLAAHHLKSDLYGVVTIFANDGLDTDLAGIMGMVTYLLNYEEKFLALRPDIGVARIQGLRDLMVGGLEDAILAAEAAEEEYATDSDQTDEVFTVIQDRDRNKILVLNVWRNDIETGEPIMNEIELVNPDVIQAAADLRSHLIEGGDPVPFDGPISMSLSAALILPIGFGLLDWLDLSLEELLGLSYDLVSPALLETLLTGLLNLDVVALDLYTYLENPIGLRDMLPAWTNDQPPFENKLFTEWECPDELLDDGAPDGSGKFICAGEAETLVDAAHFVGTPYEIAADGHTVKSPYLAMQDPTFGGMLYIDPEALALAGYPEDPRWQEADQLSFNAALGKILASVLAFIGGIGGK